MKIFSDKKAFTLIEVIVYVAILGLLVVSFISFALAISSLRSKNYVASEVNANLRIASEIISRQIRSAHAVFSPGIGASSSEIFLDMPGVNPDVKILNSGGQIYLIETGVATSSLTSNTISIKNLRFNNYNSGNGKTSISYTIQAEYRYASSTNYIYENNIQKTVNTKN